MKKSYCVAIVLLFGIVSCGDKEQVYQGIYQEFSRVDEMRMTQDPSYDPVQAREKNVPGYQEYKIDREMILDENTGTSDGKDIKK